MSSFADQSLYAVIGIPVIFVLGLVGSLTPPVLSRCFPRFNVTKTYIFSFFNGIAGGVILAVGFIHSLPDSVDGFTSSLTENNLTDQYPWANFITMMSVLMLFTVEEILDVVSARFGIVGFDPHDHSGHHGKEKEHDHPHDAHACDHTVDEHRDLDGECDAQPLEELCDHEHHRGDCKEGVRSSEDDEGRTSSSDEDLESSIPAQAATKKYTKTEPTIKEDEPNQLSTLDLFMKMVVLFIGLGFHNIFVGLALGIGDNDYVLFIAIIFHQFFEGLGMGARVAMARLRRFLTVFFVDLVFALIPVIFIGIGIGIKHGVASADNTDGYNLTKGILQGLSAGILIYVAITHMIRAYRDNGATGTSRDWHRLSSYGGLLFGAAVMAVIGIWA